MSRITRTIHSMLLCTAVAIAGGCGGGSSNQSAPSSGAPAPAPAPADSAQPDPAIDADATFFYFSYDESASTASRDLSLFALDSGRKPSKEFGRPYEFLNAETFDGFQAQAVGAFEVSMTLRRPASGDLPIAVSDDNELFVLGVNVTGPSLPLEARRNLVLTVLVDISGSMESPYASETRSDVRSLLDVVKYGLSRIGPSLKAGDVLNLVTFSTNAQVVAEGLDPMTGAFESHVGELATNGSTDIRKGVDLAYEVANRTFDPAKANRVLLLTDAFVNTGDLDPDAIASAAVRGDLEGVRFSAIGIGAQFNDAVLNTVSDAGRGSYSAMITPNDAERLFTADFSRFIELAATNTRFRLDYPAALDQLRSFGEEISTDPQAVQPVNFSYDSSQFFVELFKSSAPITGSEELKLSIDYTDAAGETKSVSVSRSINDLPVACTRSRSRTLRMLCIDRISSVSVVSSLPSEVSSV